MKTVTLNLPDDEFNVLEELARSKDMSKIAVLRQALRVYQLVDRRIGEDRTMRMNGETFILLD